MKTLRLEYLPPLDWSSLLEFYRLRATPGVEIVDGGSYRRSIELGGKAATIQVASGTDGTSLELGLDGVDARDVERVVARVRRMFDLDLDPSTVARAFRKTPLAKLVRRRPGVRVPSAWDPFELVVRAILGQQVSVAAATTLAGRLAERFGDPVERPRSGLSRMFPRPSALAAADFTGIGLTRARAETIRHFARVVASGELALERLCGADDIVAKLVALPGIGEWTAQYVAMRAFGERDAFPAGDLGLRRAMANGAGMPSEAELIRMAESWRPFRAYAAIYLWTKP